MNWLKTHKAFCGWALVFLGGGLKAVCHLAGVGQAEALSDGLILVGTALVGAGHFPSDRESKLRG